MQPCSNKEIASGLSYFTPENRRVHYQIIVVYVSLSLHTLPAARQILVITREYAEARGQPHPVSEM